MDNGNMQLLIVEDEAAVRRSLSHKLNWEELHLGIMGEAQNAEEAYRMIKIQQPEIILLDMRMPGMGGMRFLEILNSDFPKIKVIILSGHSDFEYMRQALKCGATDYLLKPVIKEDLKNALLKAAHSVAMERRSETEKIHQATILNESIPLLRTNLLNKLITGINLDAAEVLKRLSYLHIKLDFHFYILAIIKINNFEAVKLTYMNDTSAIFIMLESIMTGSLQLPADAVGFKSMAADNEFVYIFGFDNPEGSTANLKEAFIKVAQTLERANKLTINASISDPCSKLNDLPLAYRNASQIWGKQKPGKASNILLPENFYKESQVSSLIPFTEVMAVMDYIEQNDRQGLMRFINELFQKMPDEPVSLEWCREITAKVYFCIEKAVELAGMNVSAVFDERVPAYNDLLAKCRQPEEIKHGLLRVITEVAVLLERRKKIESGKVVAKARQYINDYYFEDLSLGFLAEKFYLNPSYFCELFKKEVGSSFNKYLNMIRIEKAKELLGAQGMKPTSVAELVGFKELGYFCIVFKKYTGLTPTEYKKAIAGSA